MDANEYSTLALRTAAQRSTKDLMVEAAMGIGGEGGEVVDIVKKVFFYGKELDRQHLIEELSDLAWYMNLMVESLGTTWGEVFETNIRKLETRYPDLRFNADHAINRDVAAEKVAMGGGWTLGFIKEEV